MLIEQNQAQAESEPQNVRDDNVPDILFHPSPPKVGDDNPSIERCASGSNPYNGHRRKETAMFNQSLSASNSMRLIRFFQIVSVVGAVVVIARALIIIAIISGILYFLS